MKASLLFAFCLLCMPIDGIDFSTYDHLTKRYVDERGLVDYAGLKGELAALREFVDQLSATGPENRPDLFHDDAARLRYYLTAYNAWVIYIAASEYPSRRSLWRFGIFRNRDIRLGGRKSSLNELEHEILRKRFKDPRIHFYINCAAVSCPPVSRGAIPEGATEEVLDRAASRFINDPAHVRYDAEKNILHLSKIFDWFEADFIDYLRQNKGIEDPHIWQYIALYLESAGGRGISQIPQDKIKVRYLKYDKSLNDQGVRP